MAIVRLIVVVFAPLLFLFCASFVSLGGLLHHLTHHLSLCDCFASICCCHVSPCGHLYLFVVILCLFVVVFVSLLSHGVSLC